MKENVKQRVINTLQEQMSGTSLSTITEMVSRAEEYFLWATNRKVVPSSAFYLLLDMSRALHLVRLGNKEEGIKAIKAGDTTIEYMEQEDIYTTLRKFTASLNVYKKVKMG